MSDVRALLADALRKEIPEWFATKSYGPSAEGAVDVLLSLPGIAIVELPEPDSTRYEGEEHEPMDRLAWGTGSRFAVSRWQYPEVQVAYSDEPFEPISIAEARTFAATLLAAANAAETVQ